jgi:hypothetical protein
MQHLGGTLTSLGLGAGRMGDGKLGPSGPPLDCRDPGQTGCRPLRPLTPNRDPEVLARVLDGLRRLPGTPEPGTLPQDRHGQGAQGGGTSGVPPGDL